MEKEMTPEEIREWLKTNKPNFLKENENRKTKIETKRKESEEKRDKPFPMGGSK